MAKKSKKEKINVVAVLGTILACVFGFVALFNVSNGFSFASRDVAVIYENEYILSGRTGMRLSAADELEVKQFSESRGTISVEIYAIENKRSEVQFTYGATAFTWNEAVANTNVTEFFDVSITQPKGDKNGKIVINDGGVSKVVEMTLPGEKVQFAPFTMRGDFFRMKINVSGGDSVTVDFLYYRSAQGVSLSDEGVQFRSNEL